MTHSRYMMVLLLSVLICIYIIVSVRNLHRYEHVINIPPIDKQAKWYTDTTCKYKMTQVYLDVLNEYSIDKAIDDDWVIYFPCTYNDSDKEIDKVKPTSKTQRIFIVNNSDAIASKSHLWTNIVKKYGRDRAKDMSPTSYVLHDHNDLELFKKEYSSDKLYIMKKNIQRQEGLKITNNKDEVLGGSKNNYVVVQELLQDPYMINGRKINLRFYVLLVCQNNEIALYIHREGFVYYTKMPFVKNSLNMWSNVTTGYIDRWVYYINPLSHEDLRNYLNNRNRRLNEVERGLMENGKNISDEVFMRMYNLIKAIIVASNKHICNESKLKDYISFQLFGADIALDDKLNPKIMEFNIGPNLATHDGKDREIKHMVVRDILKTINVIPNQDNGFIQF